MKSTSTKKQAEAKKLRKQIQHLSVDLEYAGREGDSVYSEHLDKKLDTLYNKLNRIASYATERF